MKEISKTHQAIYTDGLIGIVPSNTPTQENLAELPMLHRCAFLAFFKKIIHDSKSIGPFDLILILLGAQLLISHSEFLQKTVLQLCLTVFPLCFSVSLAIV